MLELLFIFHSFIVFQIFMYHIILFLEFHHLFRLVFVEKLQLLDLLPIVSNCGAKLWHRFAAEPLRGGLRLTCHVFFGSKLQLFLLIMLLSSRGTIVLHGSAEELYLSILTKRHVLRRKTRHICRWILHDVDVSRLPTTAATTNLVFIAPYLIQLFVYLILDKVTNIRLLHCKLL